MTTYSNIEIHFDDDNHTLEECQEMQLAFCIPDHSLNEGLGRNWNHLVPGFKYRGYLKAWAHVDVDGVPGTILWIKFGKD